MSTGNFPESLSQAILVLAGIMLVGRLGVLSLLPFLLLSLFKPTVQDAPALVMIDD